MPMEKPASLTTALEDYLVTIFRTSFALSRPTGRRNPPERSACVRPVVWLNPSGPSDHPCNRESIPDINKDRLLWDNNEEVSVL